MENTERNDLKQINEDTPLLDPRQRQGSLEIDAKKGAKKPSPWFIIAPIFGLTFSFGALFAPMIQFYTVVFCYRYFQSQAGDTGDLPIENCNIPEVQAIVSEAQAVILFLTYGSTLLVASYFGALSDRKGRRLILKISGLGNIILMTSYIVTIKYINVFGISLLFIAPVVRGLLAGDSILLAASQAYISDCTTPTERTVAFGHLMAAFFSGATLGPTVSSLLIHQSGSILSIFYMVLVINVLFELYIFFILPESHDFAQFKVPHKEARSLWQRINVFSALTILVRASSEHANRYALTFIAGIQFLVTMVALPPVILYAMLQFGWTAVEGGLFVSLSSFSKLLVLILLLPLLSKIFHKTRPKLEEGDLINPQPKVIIEEFNEHEHPSASTASTSSAAPLVGDDEQVQEVDEYKIRHSILLDTWMIRLGMTAEVIALIAFGMVKTSGAFTLNAVFQSLAVLASPALRSLTTTLVKPSEVGELLGAMAVVESAAMIISQLSINTIYSASVATMPQLTFFFCAVIAGLALILSAFVRPAPAHHSSSTTSQA